MNILLINHYAGSPQHGMEYRPYYLAREWVQMGHRVTIAAASFSHLRSNHPEIKRRVTEEEIDGIQYLWYRTPEYQGNGVGRARNIFSFVRQIGFDARRLARQYQPNLVIASSTYPLDMVPAHRVAIASGATLVYEVHDLWPLTPIELGHMSPRHPFIMLLQWAENYGYRRANHVVSLLPNAADHMRQHGMAASKFCHIPNGVAMSEWGSTLAPLLPPHREAINTIRHEGRLVLGYVGGLTPSDSLDTLLDAARTLERMDVSTVLVGQGVEKESLQQRILDLGLRHTVLLPSIPKRLVPSLLAEMDACFIGWKRSPLYRFGICPNKLMDYMMAAKPVIHGIEAGNDLVAEAGCGFSIPPENSQAIVKAVESLAGLSVDERRAMGQRGRAYVTAHHDYSVLAQRFLDATCKRSDYQTTITDQRNAL